MLKGCYLLFIFLKVGNGEALNLNKSGRPWLIAELIQYEDVAYYDLLMPV